MATGDQKISLLKRGLLLEYVTLAWNAVGTVIVVERVREAGVIASQAVLIAIGIDWDGRRQVLAVELANRESRSSWRNFLLGLKARGLHGIGFVVADDHAGMRAALREVLAEANYQR